MNKPNKNTLTDTDNRLLVRTGEGGWGRVKWVRGSNVWWEVETDSGVEHATVHTDTELGGIPETYVINQLPQ